MTALGFRACLFVTGALGLVGFLAAADSGGPVRRIRATGTIQALRVSNVQVPQLRGPGGRLTLIRLIPNGSRVKPGDVVAEFDRIQQLEDAREARAKMEDLSHQIDQLRAQFRSDAAKRNADLRQAEADLAKAEIELRKGEVLSEIDRLKSQAKLETARARVASLKKSTKARDTADAAGVRIIELQRDRQQVALERAETNIEKLSVKAPIAGMVAQEMTWRNNSMGPMQEGDQAWPGNPLVRIFDPTDMIVVTQLNEPDGAAITPGTRVKVRLDAYPGVVFDAHYDSASPIASSGFNSPIKFFTARFRLDQRDPRLLPDLSAAVEVEVGGAKP
jgi:HlyD family secretion protein